MKIATIPEYLETLSGLKQTYPSSLTVACYTFFRGQANSNWRLSSSLYRMGLFDKESLLLTEIKHVCPNEIPDNHFDALVKMQHYGMPTRLIDTTTNPLVALYFACVDETEMNNDGAVYIFPNLPASWSSDPLVELIMDFVFDYSPSSVWMDQMLLRTKEKYKNVIHRLMPDTVDDLLYYLKIPAFAVMPTRANDRITAQDGAFFISGMKQSKCRVSTNPGTLGRVYYDFEPVEYKTERDLWTYAEKIVIAAESKKGILEQLDMMGINEGKLFPDLAHQVSHVVSNVVRDAQFEAQRKKEALLTKQNQ